MQIDSSQTPEKFLSFKEEVFVFLIDGLQALDKLEFEINGRYETLQAKRTSLNQVHPDEDGLWREYSERSREIIEPISTRYEETPRTIGKPTAYEYWTLPNTKFAFIMKSANRAVVETEYDHGISQKHQFVLKREGEVWKIDSKKYSFPGEETWYKDEI